MPEALRNLINAHVFTEAEMRKLLNDATREASRVAATLDASGSFSANIRKAQQQMALVNARLWEQAGGVITTGIGDAVWEAKEFQALYDERLFKAAGIDAATWRNSMRATAQRSIENVVSRKQNGFTLSQRIYKNRQLAQGYVDRALNNGLLLGKSAREIAKDVVGFYNPNVPGGASYAAQRLARTEIQNAHHTTALRGYQQTPWIRLVKWNLSGRHTRADQCNFYAEKQHYTGGAGGVFRVMEVPGKPHPNCLCYITPMDMDLDEYAKRFKRGEFDDYINNQMHHMRVGKSLIGARPVPPGVGPDDIALRVFEKMKAANLDSTKALRQVAKDMGITFEDAKKLWLRRTVKKPPKVVRTPDTKVKPTPKPTTKSKSTATMTPQEAKSLVDDYIRRHPELTKDKAMRLAAKENAITFERLKSLVRAAGGTARTATRKQAAALQNLFKRKNTSMSQLDDAKATNYSRSMTGRSSNPLTHNNCTSCTTTWELRRRGYDVTARTMAEGQPQVLFNRAWGVRVADQIGHPYRKQASGIPDSAQSTWLHYVRPREVGPLLSKEPVGARGSISVIWKQGGAHIYNWEVRETTTLVRKYHPATDTIEVIGERTQKEVWFIDAQVGREWPLSADTTLGRVADDYYGLGTVHMNRLDKLEPSREDLEWLTSEQGAQPVGKPSRKLTQGITP